MDRVTWCQEQVEDNHAGTWSPTLDKQCFLMSEIRMLHTVSKFKLLDE